jgi:hypothetical protein
VELREQPQGADAPQGRGLPTLFSLDPLPASGPSRQFDEAYTAPHHGFRDADDYYYRASAMRVIERIRVPDADPARPKTIRSCLRTVSRSAVTGNPASPS